MSNLLTRQKLAVRCKGELVELQIGDSTITMEYETAIQLSQWLRVNGKQAKNNAGDKSRHWSAIGNLEGLTQ